MYPSSSEGLNKETDEAVYFFSSAFYCFDNFSAHQVTLWGITFPTAEYAYQWKKFSQVRPDVAAMILAAPSPEAVYDISRMHKASQPETWRNEKLDVMEEIISAKIEQHDDVREALKRSGQRKIIENSPFDSFWGAGSDGQGQNMLGKTWMKLRDLGISIP